MRSNMHHSIDSFLINMAIPFKASLLRHHLLVSQHAPTRTLFSQRVPNMKLYPKPGSYLRTISSRLWRQLSPQAPRPHSQLYT